MNVVEQVENSKLPVGGKPGQTVLFVDLSEVEQPTAILHQLTEEGYQVQIRYVEFAIGLHVIAVLKNETDISDERHELLLEEWEALAMRLTPTDPNKAVRLWRCYAKKSVAA